MSYLETLIGDNAMKRIEFEEKINDDLAEALNDIGVVVWYGILTSQLDESTLADCLSILLNYQIPFTVKDSMGSIWMEDMKNAQT